MENDFSKPQRQSLIGVLVMFGDTFQKALRALWPILIVWIVRFDEMSKISLIVGAVAILAVVGVIAYLKYLNFTFFLDEENEEFVVNKGVLKKSRIAISLDKIQQVNINQSIIQKIIGVYALEVDTAGSGGNEVSIKAIKHDLALALKERLLKSGRDTVEAYVEDGNNTAGTANGHPFIKISLLSLLKTGITSNYARSFALLLAFFITILQYVDDYIDAAGYEEDPLANYINADVLLSFFSFILIAVIVLTLVVNLARTIIKYFDYKITRQPGSSLLLSYGLLNTKNSIIRPEKVQIVTVGRNYFQKKMDIQDVKIRQAANLENEDKEQRKSAIEIPGCSEAEKNILLQFLLEKIPERGVALKPDIRKVIMEVIKFLILPVCIFFGVSYFLLPSVFEYALLVPVYVVFVGILIYFAYRNSRLFVTDDFIVKKSGAWDVDKEYVAPHKIQAIALKQFFWHRKADIGTVTLHTAGGTISFGLANYTRLKELVNVWMYRVETTNKNWM